MHDGECPKCHHVADAEEFRDIVYDEWDPQVKEYVYKANHRCRKCGFTIPHEVLQEAVKLFAMYMEEACEVYEQWLATLEIPDG